MSGLLWLIDTVLNIYIWMLIASAVLSWLIAFNVINTGNRFVYQVLDFLHKVTDPLLRPIRRILPDLGGVDISPIILIIVIKFIQIEIHELYVKFLIG